MNNQIICLDRRLLEKKFMLMGTGTAGGHSHLDRCDFGFQYPNWASLVS